MATEKDFNHLNQALSDLTLLYKERDRAVTGVRDLFLPNMPIRRTEFQWHHEDMAKKWFGFDLDAFEYYRDLYDTYEETNDGNAQVGTGRERKRGRVTRLGRPS